MKRTLALFTLAIASVLLFSTAAIAAEPAVGYAVPKLQVDIPGVSFESPVAVMLEKGGEGLSINFLGAYISGVYKYLIGFALTIAIVMIMIGGLQYVLGASSGDVKNGKKRMTDAIEGFILLMFVYVILYTVNPETTLFKGLKLKYIKEIPSENFFEPSSADAIACTASGEVLKDVNDFQDCMLSHFGSSEAEARAQLVSVKYKKRTYSVHSLIKNDFEAALAAIDNSGVDYDITTDWAGGTFNWRCNKNNPKAVSAHSWGSAIDVNPSTNPNCPRKCTDGNESTACSCVGGTKTMSCEIMCNEPRPYDMPQEVIDAFVKNGFSWGGNYRRTPDYMHFTHTRICTGG